MAGVALCISSPPWQRQFGRGSQKPLAACQLVVNDKGPFIIHSLDWQAGNNSGSFASYGDYPLTGLLPRNARTGISRP
jgi:hypothetical protein